MSSIPTGDPAHPFPYISELAALAEVPDRSEMSGQVNLTISDTALHKTAAAICGAPSYGQATLRKAAVALETGGPLIVADELDAQAAALEGQAEALGVPRVNTPASGVVATLAELARGFRLRASELRGGVSR